MALHMDILNTFVHVSDESDNDDDIAPSLIRSVTDSVLNAKLVLAREALHEDEEDEQPDSLSRVTTFDEFEMPCELGSADDSSHHEDSGTEGDVEERQPSILRAKTYDYFEDESLLSAFAYVPMEGPVLQNSVPSVAEQPVSMPGVVSSSASPGTVETNMLVKAQHVEFSEVPPSGVSCVTCPDGSTRLQWMVEAKRFVGRAATAVSPALIADLPGCGTQTFKFIVHSAAVNSSERGGCSFQAVGGRASIELKCETSDIQAAVGKDEVYNIELDKQDGERLGVDLESRNGEPWWVKSMSSGLVSSWNASAAPERRVRVGDTIVDVNGLSRDVNAMRDRCKQSGRLCITLRRSVRPRFGVTFAVSAATGGAPQQKRGPVDHDFSEESCCSLRPEEEVWDISAIAKGSKKVLLSCQLSQAA